MVNMIEKVSLKSSLISFRINVNILNFYEFYRKVINEECIVRNLCNLHTFSRLLHLRKKAYIVKIVAGCLYENISHDFNVGLEF